MKAKKQFAISKKLRTSTPIYNYVQGWNVYLGWTLWLSTILWGWWKKGDSSLAKGWQFQRVVISARGTMGHYARLLFTIYVIIGKTCYLEMLLYCTQLDYANIGSYVHRLT
jgi:hypothetical protein